MGAQIIGGSVLSTGLAVVPSRKPGLGILIASTKIHGIPSQQRGAAMHPSRICERAKTRF
jgi:hypothetical protein